MTMRRNQHPLLCFWLALCLIISLSLAINTAKAGYVKLEQIPPTPQPESSGEEKGNKPQGQTTSPPQVQPSSDEYLAWPWKQENPEPKARIQSIQRTISTNEAISSADLSSMDQMSLDLFQANEETHQIKALSQFGGAAFRVGLSGSYAFLGLGFKLAILDISNPSAVTLVGKTQSTWADQIVGIAIKGNLAYVAAGNEGLRIVDISNKNQPKEVGFYNTPGYAWDVVVEGNTAYVADSWMGVHLIDVTTPYAPRLLDTWQTEGKAMDVLLEQNYLVIAEETEGIKVVSLNDPTQTAKLKVEGRAVGLAASLPYIYVAADSGGLRIIRMEIGNSGITLTEVGHAALTGNVYAAAYSPTNEVVYAANSNRGLRAIDVSTPSSPVEVGSFDNAGCWANDIQLQGSYAYLIDTAHGLRVLNAANPKELSQVALFNAPAPTDVFFSSSYAYLSSGSSGLRILQLQKDKEPVEIGYFDTPGYAYAVDVVAPASSTRTYAYIADWDQGLRIVDVTSPTAPYEVSFVKDIGYVRDVKVAFPYAYVAGDNQGITIINLSTNQPQVVSRCAQDDLCLPLGGSARGIAVKEAGNQKIAYVADGEKGLCTLDVSDPAAPTRLSCYSHPGVANGISLSAKYPYAYVAAGFSGGLQVLDVSSPANLVSLGAMDTEGAALQVMASDSGDVEGDYVFVADGQNGLRLVYVDPSSSPPALTEKGFFDTRGWAGNLSVLEKQVMIADGVDGLRIVELPSKILTHTVEGIIKDDLGSPVAGVEIYLNNQPYTVTDAQGAYRLSDLKTGTYTITPVLNGYLFSPSSYTLEVTDDLKDKNFFASRSLGNGLSNGEQQNGGIGGNNRENSSNTPLVPQSENRALLQGGNQAAPNPQETPVQETGTGDIVQPIVTTTPTPTPIPTPTVTPRINIFSVSGKITDIEQKPLAGIRITTNCGLTTTSDSRGNFILTFEKALDCQIIPSDDKFTFSPPKIELRAFTLTADGVLEGQQFIGIAKIKRGRITNEEGKGLAGVRVKVNEKVIETDQEGFYDLSNLAAGTYTLQPTMENYKFTPAEAVCTIPYPCELKTFIGKQEWRNIQGKVVDENGKPLDGVLISTDQGQMAQTDIEGKFSLSVPPMEVAITPQKQGYVFSPSPLVIQIQQMTEEIVIKAELQKNIITGTVMSSENTPISGVIVRDNLGNETTTDAQGQYSISLPYGSLSVQAQKEGYEFQPSLYLLDTTHQKTVYDFIAVAREFSIKIKVIDSTGQPIEGVRLDAPKSSSWVTDINGLAIINLKTGKSYLTPNKNGYRFTPEVVELNLPGSETEVNITAQALDYHVKGQVFESDGMPIGQVLVKLDDQKQLYTDALGRFEINLKPGSYEMNALKDGYIFSPNLITLKVPFEQENLIEIQGSPICPNVLENGSFEKDSGWGIPSGSERNSGTRIATDEEGVAVIQGRRAAMLGALGLGKSLTGYDAIRQKVIIPKGAKSAMLRYWVYFAKVGQGSSNSSNVQMGLILDENQKEIERLFSKNSDERKWQAMEKDLSQYRGKTLWLYFGTYNSGKDAAVGMLVDDVSLQICQ